MSGSNGIPSDPGGEPIPEDQTIPELAPYNVVGSFQEPGQARDAVVAVQALGIDGVRISLLSPARESAEDEQRFVPAEEHVEATPSGGGPGEAMVRSDQEFSEDMILHAAEGAGLGSILGAISGAAVVAVIPGIGPIIGAGMLGTMLGAGAFGAFAGGFINVVAHTGTGPAWRETFAELAEKRLLVAVHVDEPDRLDATERALADAGAVRVLRVDEGGHVIAAVDPDTSA